MVDQTDPSTQFHPYQPATETPASERPSSGMSGMLRKVGISDDVISKVTGALSGVNVTDSVDKLKSSVNVDSMKEKWNSMDVKGSVNSARDYARRNPGKVLGGLALAIIGTGLLTRRSRSFSR